MQVNLIFLAGNLAITLINLLVVTFAIYFAGRIMAGQVITLRNAFIGALIVEIIQAVAFWIMLFIFPILAEVIGIIVAMITLIVVTIRFYDFGYFGTIALVMLALVMFMVVQVMSVALYYIFFVPLP